MLVAFVGDLHGRVFHAIAAVATWQRRFGRQFDLVVQVGDLGAFPNLDRIEPATDPHLAADPAEADFARLLKATGERAARLTRLRRHIVGPILFIRGNHEDHSWLRGLLADGTRQSAVVDPFDFFCYVADGTVQTFQGLRIGFLGGVEEQIDDAAIDRDAYASLIQRGPGTIDLLVTHEGPYDSSIGYHGDVHGSPLISRLVERIRPRIHVAGHAHQVSGPGHYGPTTYVGLDGIVASPRWHPDAVGLQAGSLALLDTARGGLTSIAEPWLRSFSKPFDFDAWADRFLGGDV